MKWRWKDAHTVLREEKKTNTIAWRKTINELKMLTNERYVTAFIHLVEIEKRRQRKTLRGKRKKKVQFLVNKHKNNEKENKENEVNEDLKGIEIKDQPLPSNFESKPRIYGGIKIDSHETALLELPPKYTVYSRIKTEDVETEIEKGITKLRWTERKRK